LDILSGFVALCRQIPSYAENRTKSRILMEIEGRVAAWGIVLTSFMGGAWSLCRITCGDRANTMGDESAKRAAQEYLAGKLSAEGQRHEDKLNREAAEKLGPAVWKTVADTVLAQCREWNGIANEQTFTCRETMLGDLRILCAERSQQMVVHFDSRKLLVIIKNSARLEHGKDVGLFVEGYATASGRDARLMRNGEPVNLSLLITGELRVLAGLGRRA